MIKCWNACKRFERPTSEGYAPNFNEFIQSLQQPKMPIEFDTITIDNLEETITNSQGFTQWVGKYIFDLDNLFSFNISLVLNKVSKSSCSKIFNEEPSLFNFNFSIKKFVTSLG